MPQGLLLIHGFPLDHTMWDPQIEAFSSETTVIAPDMPGFGQSPPLGDVTTMEQMADFCASAIDAAGVDRVVVCGLSMGGYVALAFWRRHRASVIGMALANTRAGADDAAAKERRAGLATRVRAEGSGFLVESPPPMFSEQAPAELWQRAKASIAAQPIEGIAAGSLGIGARPDSTDLLAGIDVPTLVITGSLDTLIPPAATEETAKAIPGAQYRVIEGAGHLSNVEAPEAFNALLREHLVRCGVIEGGAR